MSRGTQRMYPVDPLVELAAGRGAFTNGDVAELCGIDIRNFLRWKARGTLRWDSADRAACALGVHPAELWPSWFDDSFTDTAEAKLRARASSREYVRRRRVLEARYGVTSLKALSA